MDPPIHWLHHKIFLTVISLMILNLLILNIYVGLNYKTVFQSTFTKQEKNISPPPSSTQSNNQSCSPGCTTNINEMGEMIKTYAENVASSQEATRATEFFIPLGAGTTNSGDWTDITGAEAVIDSSKYGKIKKVTFDVSARSPNNNQIIYVRLFNDSNQAWVSNSEVDFPSGTTQYYLPSSPITLGYGVKLYKVQMKTQLLFPAVLDQARIHIITY